MYLFLFWEHYALYLQSCSILWPTITYTKASLYKDTIFLAPILSNNNLEYVICGAAGFKKYQNFLALYYAMTKKIQIQAHSTQ